MWRRVRAAILAGAGPVVAGRQDPSHQSLRLHPVRQSRSGIAGLVIRSPQYPGVGVGLRWPTVGHGVRRESVGRAQLDPVGRQLWVAHCRGPCGHRRVDRPGDPMVDRRRRHPPDWLTSAVPYGSRPFAVSGSSRSRSGPTARWALRRRCLSGSTGVCGQLLLHRTARFGSPPATATGGGDPATATTGSSSSGPEPTAHAYRSPHVRQQNP